MATWVSLVNDTCARPNSATGSPGNNWIDSAGIFSISGNQFYAVPTTLGTTARLTTLQILRPSVENLVDQRIVLTTGTTTIGGNAWAVILRWIDNLNFYYVTMDSGSNSVVMNSMIGGSITALGSVLFPAYNQTNPNTTGFLPGHNYTIDFQVTGTSPTTLQATVTDTTASLPYNITSRTNSASPLQAAGRSGFVANYFSTQVPQRTSQVQTFYNLTASMTTSPTVLSTLQGNQTVAVTGVGTAFSGTPFTVSGGGSIVSTTINSGTSATLTINPGVSVSSQILKDTVSGALAYLPAALPLLTISPTSIVAGSSGNSISVTGTAPVAWTPGTPGSPTLTASSGATITAQTINTSLSATLTMSGGSLGAQVTITDPNSGATGTLDVLKALPPGDANLFQSPYNWYTSGGSAQTSNCLAYLYAAGTFSNAYINVDVSSLVSGGVSAANYPTLVYAIDNSPWTYRQLLSSDSTITLSQGVLSYTTHTIAVYLDSTGTGIDRWNGSPPTMTWKTSGIVTNGTYTTPILKTKRLLLYWDSLGQGYTGAITGVVVLQDALQASVLGIANGLGAEVGNVSFNGGGWTVAAGGNVPALYTPGNDTSSSWNKYSSGLSRLSGGLFSPAPDYIVSLMGTNDGQTGASDASVTASVTGWITAVRAAAPLAKIFVIVPPGGWKQSAIQAGVVAYQAAVPFDQQVYYVYLGSAISVGLTGSTAGGTFASPDGVHPRAFINSQLAGLIVQALNPLIAQTGVG